MIFVIFGSTWDYWNAMWSPVKNEKNVFLYNQYFTCNKLHVRFLYFLYKKNFFNNICGNFFKRILYRYFYDHKIEKTKDQICYIFFDANPHTFDKNFLKYLKKKKNIRTVLYILNPLGVLKRDLNYISDYFNLTFTTFEEDAVKYKLHYDKNKIYSMPVIKEKPIEKKGVFYVGYAKKRLDIIHKAYLHLTSNNIECLFFIAGVSDEKKLINSNIQYNIPLKYIEVINNIHKYNCILEVFDPNQYGGTLRSFEAFYYNKKLITNNPLIFNHRLYKNTYIHCFNDPSFIDPNFIKSDIDVQYVFDRNISSPQFFLKTVMQKLEFNHSENAT